MAFWACVGCNFVNPHRAATCAGCDMPAEEEGQDPVDHTQPAQLTIEAGNIVTDRESRFLAHVAFPVTNAADLAAALARIRSDPAVAGAAHHPCAWRFSSEGWAAEGRCDDDGEEHAGRRLLSVLARGRLTDVLIVVSRWWGGINLGPKRFAHFSHCAQALLSRGSVAAMLAAQLMPPLPPVPTPPATHASRSLPSSAVLSSSGSSCSSAAATDAVSTTAMSAASLLVSTAIAAPSNALFSERAPAANPFCHLEDDDDWGRPKKRKKWEKVAQSQQALPGAGAAAAVLARAKAVLQAKKVSDEGGGGGGSGRSSSGGGGNSSSNSRNRSMHTASKRRKMGASRPS